MVIRKGRAKAREDIHLERTVVGAATPTLTILVGTLHLGMDVDGGRHFILQKSLSRKVQKY